MARLSVIVPVYNVEDYIDWCLESLQGQTFQDIEIICVNDGSTDSSPKKLKQWQNKDPRIKVIDKENGGLSSARNSGIAQASSDYVCFLDSDDRFTPDACKTIFDALNSSKADVMTFGAHCYPKEAAYPWLTDHLSPRDTVYEPFHEDLLFKEMSRPFAWRTACRRNFLTDNNLFFDETLRFGEDQVFHFAIYPRSKKTILCSAKLYDYRVSREGSLMHSFLTDLHAKCSEHIRIVERILADWDKAGFLDLYTESLLSWIVEFVIYESLCLPENEVNDIFAHMQPLMTKYWTSNQIKSFMLPKATKTALLFCFNERPVKASEIKRTKLSYRIERDGISAFAKSILRR